jgi:hypothetical protein
MRDWRAVVLGAAASGVLTAAACGGSSSSNDASPVPQGDGEAGVTSTTSQLPCDVDAILAKNCWACHSDPPQFGAPMSLMTWDALHAPAPTDRSRSVYELVPERIANDAAPMPPPPSARLGDADRKTLTDWASTGAPSSSVACDGTGAATPPSMLDCKGGERVSLTPGSAYTMPADVGDQYVCWGMDLAKNPAAHITAFGPRIDNTTIVHHVVLYESPTAFPAAPAPCSAASSFSWRIVFGWAPGVKSLELPPDVGFPIGTTTPTHYVVQMHYSNARHLAGQVDSSGFDLCTGPPRANEADVLAFGTQDIHIPPAPPAGGVYSLACSLTVPAQAAGIHMIAAMPHMHKLGVRMSTILTPKAGGDPVDLGTTPSFSFDTQTWYPLGDRAVSAAGDVITTTCGWTNTTGAEVNFGEKTSDEMCYSFTMYWPRITYPGWSWVAPALSPPIGAACTVH